MVSGTDELEHAFLLVTGRFMAVTPFLTEDFAEAAVGGVDLVVDFDLTECFAMRESYSYLERTAPFYTVGGTGTKL